MNMINPIFIVVSFMINLITNAINLYEFYIKQKI